MVKNICIAVEDMVELVVCVLEEIMMKKSLEN
jgi:hypothetical protein